MSKRYSLYFVNHYGNVFALLSWQLLQYFLPDSDEVMWAVNLKQGEIQFYAKARSNWNQPRAVCWVWVLLWVSRGKYGPIVWCDVASTRNWENMNEGRQSGGIHIYQCGRDTVQSDKHKSAVISFFPSYFTLLLPFSVSLPPSISVFVYCPGTCLS